MGCVSVTQSDQMPRFLVLALAATLAAWSQSTEEVRIDTEHPRLLLPARRLKLLKRERERQSIRWQQLELLMTGGARMPEPGFSQALYYQITGDEGWGRKAVGWALDPSAQEARQLALVFDWCQPVLTPPQSAALVAKLRKTLDQPPSKASDIPSVRDRVFAALALAGHVPKAPETLLQAVLNQWWTGKMKPQFDDGGARVPRRDIYALTEILHAVRDNLNLDLRETSPTFFKELPVYHLLSHYPASYPAAENEYRIPVFDGQNEPDLDQAALSRAAELAMVAFDSNALETQFLQGWLTRDRFLMRGAFGIAYEFLWANPYQPGLSVYHMPLWFHDPRSGRLIARSSWEEDADWFGHLDGFTQFFSGGRIQPVDLRTATSTIQVSEATIVFPRQASRYRTATETTKALFVVGLKPHQDYDIEVDDEEMREVQTDADGILAVEVTPGSKGGLRLAPAHRPPGASSRPPSRASETQ